MCYLETKKEKMEKPNGVNEMERKFKHFKNKINEDILNQIIPNRFPKDETIDQLEKVFVFDLETWRSRICRSICSRYIWYKSFTR